MNMRGPITWTVGLLAAVALIGALACVDGARPTGVGTEAPLFSIEVGTDPLSLDLTAIYPVGVDPKYPEIGAGELIAFRALAYGGAPPLEFYWDFEDRTTVVDGSIYPHTYGLTGTYLVVAKVVDSAGTTVTDALSVTVIPAVIPVDIDIKPGSDPNSINCTNTEEVITVAILTSADFDALTVDHTTVTFEGASETHLNSKTYEARRHEEDVDLDGDLDLVLHFRNGDTTLTCASTQGTLGGQTYDGQEIEGSDAVNMIS